MPLLEDGHSVRDTYEVERFLGEGAFAEVYRVRHRYLGRQALKLFKLAGLTASEVEEMLGEAVLLSHLGSRVDLATILPPRRWCRLDRAFIQTQIMGSSEPLILSGITTTKVAN
jgi:serine/threonine protein kinase